MKESNLNRWLHHRKPKAISTSEWVRRMKAVDEAKSRELEIQIHDGVIFVFCKKSSLQRQRASN